MLHSLGQIIQLLFSKKQASILETPVKQFRLLQDYPKLSNNFEILAEGFGQKLTMEKGLPVDANQNPIPWFTYPAIEYLSRFDFCGARIFEYGCGFSTLFWSRAGAQVWSVDHKKKWLETISSQNPVNTNLLLRENKNSYPTAINDVGGMFDIIVVDGVLRERCIIEALPHLSPSGFIILDNSDWYWEIAAELVKKGFLEISLSGFGPINDYTWSTSLFFPASLGAKRLRCPRPIGGNLAGGVSRDDWW